MVKRINIELRVAKRKNFKTLAKFYLEGYTEKPFNEPWTIFKVIRKLKLFSKYSDIWEIYFNNLLIGFIIINPNQWCPGEVIFGEEMAIKREFRRKGIATEVFNKIFDIYKQRGYKRYMGIVNKKSKSWGLHQKIGVKETKENKLLEREL